MHINEDLDVKHTLKYKRNTKFNFFKQKKLSEILQIDTDEAENWHALKTLPPETENIN